MALQVRIGPESQLDKTKAAAGEFLSATDTKKIWHAFSPGDTKQLLTSEDVNDIIELSEVLQERLDDLNALIVSKLSINDSAVNTTQGWSSDKITKFATNTNTVDFVQATVDADIATGDNHTTLWSKTKKRFSVINIVIAAFRVMFAPAYSPDIPYALGKFVTQNDMIYKCNTAIPVKEVWTIAHWTATNLGAEINTINTNLESSISVSTSEHVVGKWIDGKPLYRKTYDIGALPNATDKFTAHGISNLKIIARIYGSATTNDGYSIPLPYSNSVKVSTSPTNITITTINNESAYMRSYVTLEYTKTTD